MSNPNINLIQMYLNAGYKAALEGRVISPRCKYNPKDARDVALITGWRLGNRHLNPPQIDPFAWDWPSVASVVQRACWTPKMATGA